MLRIAAVVLVDSLTSPVRFLAAQRSRPAALAGLWELPGGKVEPGESPRAAAIRESAEELEVEVRLGQRLCRPTPGDVVAALDDGPAPVGATASATATATVDDPVHDWPLAAGRSMAVYFAEIVAGSVRPSDAHLGLRWIPIADGLRSGLAWIPADEPIVAAAMVRMQTGGLGADAGMRDA